MKRKVGILLLFLMVFSSSSTSVFAATVTPRYVPPEYTYVHNSTSFAQSRDWTHESRNPTDVVQNTSYSVSRTKSSSINITAEATKELVIAKVGLSIEVAFGSSKTTSESHTWNIPGHSKYNCIYGSQIVIATGYEDYYWNNILQSHTFVSGRWTYQSYDDMEYLGSY